MTMKREASGVLYGVIKPALKALGDRYHSPEAEMLLLGTAATESAFKHVRQIGGPALSFFQIEPRVARDMMDRYLPHRQPEAYRAMIDQAKGRDLKELLVEDQIFAAMMCRMIYWSKPDAMPDTLLGQAGYWKEHYNTALGAGTAVKYVDDFHALVGDFEVGEK